MLINVYYVLYIAEHLEEDMTKPGWEYELKDSVILPDRYLGGKIGMVLTDDGSVAWSLSCYDYLISAVKQVKDELSQKDLTLK